MQLTATERARTAFVEALERVMWADMYCAQEDVLTAIEDKCEVLLLDACSRLYAVDVGYGLIESTKAFNIDPPEIDGLCPELYDAAFILGEYLHEHGMWADPEVIAEAVEDIFSFEEEDADSPGHLAA
jgi:hypothetical protein